MNKWGYKNGIIYGLLLSCLGAIVMYPAVEGASSGDSNVFYYVLGALFIVGLGSHYSKLLLTHLQFHLVKVKKVLTG